VSTTAGRLRCRTEGKNGVQNGVYGAVKQGGRVCEGENRLRNESFVLGPDVDEMDDEIRRPADDKEPDYRQRHFQRLHLLLSR